jgi:membrane-associated protein
MFDINSTLQGASALFAILLVAGIVFAESGLLIGFFLPGDTLLFGAGLLASQGELPLIPLTLAVIAAAIIGDNVGYSIGRRAGHRLFTKKDSLLFKHEHVKRAEKFYDDHGGKTIIIARFVPIVRTFAPVVAGIGKMPRSRFMYFNVLGGMFWGAGITLLGYWFGQRIPHLDKYIELIFIGIVVLSLGLSLLHILREKDNRVLLAQKIKSFLSRVFLNKRVD